MTLNKSVRVFAPATVANVGCGFDIFGLAVDSPGDEVVAEASKNEGIALTKITGDDGRLPTETFKNTAGVAAHHVWEDIKNRAPELIEKCPGATLELHKKMPIGSGLGSSAASAVAAAMAVNELYGAPLKRSELLPHVMKAEAIACGAAHADNVAPSLLGGFVLIRSYDPLEVISIPVPEDLYVVVVHPDIEIRTDDSRAIMKKDLKLKDAVKQFGNTAGLIAGLFKGDYELIGRSLDDVVAEPHRSLLIPGYAEIKKAALSVGALGVGLSGSGPSIFALAKGESTAKKAKEIMVETFQNDIGLNAQGHLSKVNRKGAHLI